MKGLFVLHTQTEKVRRSCENKQPENERDTLAVVKASCYRHSAIYNRCGNKSEAVVLLRRRFEDVT